MYVYNILYKAYILRSIKVTLLVFIFGQIMQTGHLIATNADPKNRGAKTKPPKNVVTTTLTKFTNSFVNRLAEEVTTNAAVFGRRSSS